METNQDINHMQFSIADGYICDAKTGKCIVWYECDPDKNTECNKSICRKTNDTEGHNFGFCSKTNNPAYRKEGTSPWYAVLKNSPDGGEPYWGREYIEGV